jgi:hypothetical protein
MNNKVKLIAIGTDPEVFIRDTKNECFISAEGLIGGTKDFPLPITESGHAIQEDNVMAEFCVPPARDPKTMYDNINFVINHLNKKVEAINPDYMIVVRPSAEFTLEQLNTDQAQTVGCDPDYNAWFKVENPSVELPDTIRAAGGHVHISYENNSEEVNYEFVKVLDLFLGLPSVIMDYDDRRKEIYGTPGRFRHKSYGLEYRTLSNYWIDSFETVEWVFNQVNKAIEFFNAGNTVPEDVPVAIDTNDKEKALILCKKYDIQILSSSIVIENEKEEYVGR